MFQHLKQRRSVEWEKCCSLRDAQASGGSQKHPPRCFLQTIFTACIQSHFEISSTLKSDVKMIFFIYIYFPPFVILS